MYRTKLFLDCYLSAPLEYLEIIPSKKQMADGKVVEWGYELLKMDLEFWPAFLGAESSWSTTTLGMERKTTIGTRSSTFLCSVGTRHSPYESGLVVLNGNE